MSANVDVRVRLGWLLGAFILHDLTSRDHNHNALDPRALLRQGSRVGRLQRDLLIVSRKHHGPSSV